MCSTVNAEPMWRLSLGGGTESYPERPNEADCIYYLKTGFCGYGVRCRFNHPRDRNLVKILAEICNFPGKNSIFRVSVRYLLCSCYDHQFEGIIGLILWSGCVLIGVSA